MQDEVYIRGGKGALHAINRTIDLHGGNPRIGQHAQHTSTQYIAHLTITQHKTPQ